jgi:ACT domain-containing protein
MLQEVTDLIPQLVQSLGPAGASLGIMVWVMLRRDKRCEDRVVELEKSQEERYKQMLDMQKENVREYIELVEKNTQVLADLTSCLGRMKDTLDRIDRKD